jgi:Fe-S cluster assembly protein SufB
MLDLRLKALKVFRDKDMPNYGPDLSNLNLDEIYYYAKPE